MFVCFRKNLRAEPPERGARLWLLRSRARGSTPWPLSLCRAERREGRAPGLFLALHIPWHAGEPSCGLEPPAAPARAVPPPALCPLTMLGHEHRDCRALGHDPAPGRDQAGIRLGSGRVRCPGAAEGLMQCACSCSAGNVAHLPGEARALHGLALPAKP